MRIYTCERDITVNGEVFIPKGKKIVMLTSEDLNDTSSINNVEKVENLKMEFHCNVIGFESQGVQKEYHRRLENKKRQKKKLTPLQRQKEKERKDNRPWYLKIKR